MGFLQRLTGNRWVLVLQPFAIVEEKACFGRRKTSGKHFRKLRADLWGTC
jgi:hypothetical protein